MGQVSGPPAGQEGGVMAGSPDWKVYNARGEYLAACKRVEDAAVLADFIGAGSTIRFGHTTSGIVWREGSETQPARESWDHVAEVAIARINERRVAARHEREARERRAAISRADRGIENLPIARTYRLIGSLTGGEHGSEMEPADCQHQAEVAPNGNGSFCRLCGETLA